MGAKLLRPLLLLLFVGANWQHIGARLPDWRNDGLLWIAASVAAPDEPASLNNAAYYNPSDPRVEQWLEVGGVLEPPRWLPSRERIGYIATHMGLSRLRRTQGRDREAFEGFVNAMNLSPSTFLFK